MTQQRLCLEAGNGGVSVQVHSCDTQRATYSADAGQQRLATKLVLKSVKRECFVGCACLAVHP